MADGFLAQMLASRDPALSDRLRIALVSAASTVYAEAPAHLGHAERADLAHRLISDIEPFLPIFAPLVAAESVDVDSSDADLLAAILNVWSLVAGA